MRMLVHNAVVKLGDDAGVTRVLRLIGPSLRSTISRRWPALVR